MNRSFFLWSTPVAVMVTLALALVACSTTTSPTYFERADSNLDGRLDVNELESVLTERLFEAGDLNGNAIVTLAEWQTVLPTTDRARFLAYAPDGNMTPDQARKAVDEEGVFDRLLGAIDVNGDGIIDREEAAIFHDAMEAADGQNNVQKLKQILTKAEGI